jgi:GT2 family glycosyltransferase
MPRWTRSLELGLSVGSSAHGPAKESSRYVIGIHQFDTDEAAPTITDKELRRRWASFHGSIRMVSGPWLPRVIGRMLGEDTRRYRVARFFGRPVLRAFRALRGGPPAGAPKDAALPKAPKGSSFPLNYLPRKLSALNIAEADESTLREVAVVQVEDSRTDALAIATLNQTVQETSATWLFLASPESTDAQRVAALSVLLERAAPEDDVVFADEAGPDPYKPVLKSPAVGPHTLLSYNLVGRPALLRVTTLRQAGGFSTDAGAAFEHDAYLRMLEAGANFRHVAMVLPAGRTPQSFEWERLAHDTRRVVAAALDRRGWPARVELDRESGVVRWLPDVPTPAPSIDIVIPTRDRLDLVRQCLASIESVTTYPNYDVIILDNDSQETATLDFFAATKYRVIPCPGPFNYARIVNQGVSQSRADFVVTLNNDTIVITPDWLERMVALASLPDVGFVGACLLDQDGRFEHESIVISPYPQHLRSDSNYPRQDQFVAATRDVAAVTGAVQMVRRTFWEELGGMDEQLKVVMNDVDICLRGQLRDRYVVYTPDVRLYHHVSSSRGTLDPLDDRNRFIRRWDIFGTFRDPFFPESLLLLGETMYYRHR